MVSLVQNLFFPIQFLAGTTRANEHEKQREKTRRD